MLEAGLCKETQSERPASNRSVVQRGTLLASPLAASLAVRRAVWLAGQQAGRRWARISAAPVLLTTDAVAFSEEGRR